MFEGMMLTAAFLLVIIAAPRALIRLIRRFQKHEKERDPFAEEN